jgi:hypothetical protein
MLKKNLGSFGTIIGTSAFTRFTVVAFPFAPPHFSNVDSVCEIIQSRIKIPAKYIKIYSKSKTQKVLSAFFSHRL